MTSEQRGSKREFTSALAAAEERSIIVALDVASEAAALALARKLDPRLCRVKVGKELFLSAGPPVVARLRELDFDVFLDLKFHDIPNTVAGACRVAARLGVWMLNVHASGGRAMMSAAREAIETAEPRPLLISVTLLTSLGASDAAEIGFEEAPHKIVVRLALLAEACGLDGVVCSPQELQSLRDRVGSTFLLVTPGIRPRGDARQDQQRIETPEIAKRLGADYLVIGRPITAAADPGRKLQQIHAALSASPA